MQEDERLSNLGRPSDLNESCMKESMEELSHCLPSWVSRDQMISLLKDSGTNVVEAVSYFYEHETEFHAMATPTTVSLVDKDLPPCESAPPSNPLATAKLSSISLSPVRRKLTSKNKQSKKSRTKFNLEKQHTITNFFTKMVPLHSKGNSHRNEYDDETVMPEESEMYKEVVDRFIQIVNADKSLTTHAHTFVQKAKGDLDMALDLYYTHLGVEDNSPETIKLVPSQSKASKTKGA